MNDMSLLIGTEWSWMNPNGKILTERIISVFGVNEIEYVAALPVESRNIKLNGKWCYASWLSLMSEFDFFCVLNDKEDGISLRPISDLSDIPICNPEYVKQEFFNQTGYRDADDILDGHVVGTSLCWREAKTSGSLDDKPLLNLSDVMDAAIERYHVRYIDLYEREYGNIDAAVDAGMAFIQEHPDDYRMFNERDDNNFIFSDREIAAFALALVDCNVIAPCMEQKAIRIFSTLQINNEVYLMAVPLECDELNISDCRWSAIRFDDLSMSYMLENCQYFRLEDDKKVINLKTITGDERDKVRSKFAVEFAKGIISNLRGWKPYDD